MTVNSFLLVSCLLFWREGPGAPLGPAHCVGGGFQGELGGGRREEILFYLCLGVGLGPYLLYMGTFFLIEKVGQLLLNKY